MTKKNIAIAGGPCTGKSVLAAHLYAHLKLSGFDYDLILEECRKLKKEFGKFNDPFERFYMWRQQEREELRSNAEHGFITDKPLFDYYTQVKLFASQPRDQLARRGNICPRRLCARLIGSSPDQHFQGPNPLWMEKSGGQTVGGRGAGAGAG